MTLEFRQAAARDFVAFTRARTRCELCGAQPIEWHHRKHQPNGNYRVATMASRGTSIPRLQAEMDKCQPLCRSCHMRIDGRTERLHANKPHQKGQTYVEPQPCTRCGQLSKPTWRTMCRRCYDAARRT